QTLINTYPDSEYTPSAYFSIADSFYREGGTENLLQAESQYKDFIIYFPTHEMADDAQLKVCAVNFKLMNAPDRDSTFTRKAATELKKFHRDYPDSELYPVASEALREVEENQAKGVQGIAGFYNKKKSFRAAESRYKEVADKFPEFSQLDKTYFRLAEVLLELDRAEEASVYYSSLVEGFPFSEYYKDAKEMLILLEKPVPEPNPAEVERRMSNLPPKDDGSFMNPMRLLKDIFSGREDLYEVAKKRAEEKAMQAAMAAGGGQDQGAPNGTNGQDEAKKKNKDQSGKQEDQ
ncbi:MAG: outer membrane protein assembly factor BamD, partial [Acidobacteriota bacterium]